MFKEIAEQMIMKLALLFLAVLPLILGSTMEEKRFLEFLHLNNLVDQLMSLANSGMGQQACVALCTTIAGPLSLLCDQACKILCNS
ncbi:hypothetical protein CHS0354_012971 [Potamilus streckersoni]|uniref:Uncharacterized protein n=1 Tax=Potamilus streckersoni TaxID=2493646 RepID=A0AAE0VI27_9BIVA|nr:hypothetical protein CHS0354_012971 [Potamilus streckersoni]